MKWLNIEPKDPLLFYWKPIRYCRYETSYFRARNMSRSFVGTKSWQDSSSSIKSSSHRLFFPSSSNIIKCTLTYANSICTASLKNELKIKITITTPSFRRTNLNSYLKYKGNKKRKFPGTSGSQLFQLRIACRRRTLYSGFRKSTTVFWWNRLPIWNWSLMSSNKSQKSMN